MIPRKEREFRFVYSKVLLPFEKDLFIRWRCVYVRLTKVLGISNPTYEC